MAKGIVEPAERPQPQDRQGVASRVRLGIGLETFPDGSSSRTSPASPQTEQLKVVVRGRRDSLLVLKADRGKRPIKFYAAAAPASVLGAQGADRYGQLAVVQKRLESVLGVGLRQHLCPRVLPLDLHFHLIGRRNRYD